MTVTTSPTTIGKNRVVTDPLEPEREARRPLTRRQRKALIFVPIVVAIGLLVASLGIPWQAVVVALLLFILVMLLEG